MRPNKPNFLIIISDQLRRCSLGTYGDNNAETPNIDSLAQRGVRFNNACSTYPLCVPFRYGLMTGQYAHNCMIPALGWRISPAERTLADEFNDAGYQTAYFGKWHLYGGQTNMEGFSCREESLKPVPKTHQGRWQYWRGFELCNDAFNTNYFVDDDPKPIKLEGYQTDGIFDLAIEFIMSQRDKSKPFCSVISVEPPHDPFISPDVKLEEKWLSKKISLRENFFVSEVNSPAYPGVSRLGETRKQQTLREHAHYYAMIENLDRNVGSLMDSLRTSGLYDNTIVLFMSDHGELMGSHSLLLKEYPYEESIGIPLIVSGCDIPGNKQIDTPVATEDLFPTILGLAGIEPKVSTHGCNAAPLVYGDVDHLSREGVLLQFIWEPRDGMAFYGQMWRGLRSSRYKYTVLGDFNGLKPWQFFDLENDPCELNNLIENQEYQDLIARHHLAMRQRMMEVGDIDIVPNPLNKP